MPLREYAGNAKRTTLSADITAVSTTITIADGTNWPTGVPGNFFIIIDRGLSNEEKILCSSRSGNTLTVAGSGRGADSTAAAAHTLGAFVEHGLTATDIREVNDHTFDTTNDDHTQYLNNARHDVEARHTFGAALGTAATPGAVARTAAIGSGANPAREDHVHNESVRVGVVLRRAAVQSIPDITQTNISWDTEDQDTDGFIAVPGTTLAVPAGFGGLFAISFAVVASGGSIGTGRAFVNILAGVVNWRAPIGVSEDTASVSAVMRLAAADGIQGSIFHTLGSARDFTARLEMFRLGA